MNRESERKRLVELLQEASLKTGEHIRDITKKVLLEKGSFSSKEDIDRRNIYEMEADYLLDNGVIVPKYEIGQKFYIITPHGIYHSSYEICGIQLTDELRYIYCDVCDDDLMSFGEEDVGKTIFFSEEAEKALERKEDEGK